MLLSIHICNNQFVNYFSSLDLTAGDWTAS